MTSLKEIWTSFQRNATTQSLADDATLTYITSCKQFVGAQEVVKQLSNNASGLQSLKEQVVSCHESAQSLVNEVAASFVFEFDGKMNPFLPGLEDNMISGKRVEVPLVYSITFSGEKIRAIRVFWDQATVLKQIDVIGTRGRGWPVYDGAEQSRLLVSDFKPENIKTHENHASRPTTATRDPHASLQLFEKQPEAQRHDFGPQDYEPRVKAEPSNYDELFVNEKSARPDELMQRQGSQPQRQVTFGQSQTDNAQQGMARVNLNESIGHAGRTSHFEFGTPDANSSEYQKNEIPIHNKAGIRDHNRMTEEAERNTMRAQPRYETTSHFAFGTDSPTPGQQKESHRGPPRPSFDAFSNNSAEHNIHGREFNMARRPPPQSQFDFVSGDNEAPPLPASRAASHNYNQARKEEQESSNIHNREYNMSRRPPPQAQYDLMADDDVEKSDSGNIHGRDFNMSRRSPPQAQFNFMEDSVEAPIRPSSKGGRPVETENAQSDNIHGREYNMSRRPPPQAQFDFMSESAQPQEQAFGRRSQQQQETEKQDSSRADNIHGREYNMSRRPPPQAQYDFMGEPEPQAQQSFGRASQRNFTPSYDLGDGSEEPDNIHGRTHNMSRRGPPAPQNNFLG